MPRSLPALTLLACALALVALRASAQDRRDLPLLLKVESSTDRLDALVELPWPQELVKSDLRLTETTAGQQTPVPVQWDQPAARLVWIASGKTAAGSPRTFRLDQGPSAHTAPHVQLVASQQAVEAAFGGKKLLRYNVAHVEAPSGSNPNYGRSGHLHPVWTPSGAIVTDEFPPDHAHQSGIFLAYTKTKFEGRTVDFWNIAGGQARVRCQQLKEVASGPVFGRFAVEHEHVDLTAPTEAAAKPTPTAGGKPALIERWDVRIIPAGFQRGLWCLDIVSSARCAGDSPLELPEYHYGGMAIRGARQWKPAQVKFFTSEGDERIKGNHTRPRWCDVSGAVEGQQAGALFMTHPANFRFPEPLRIHPTMPYMVYTPSFLGDWKIAPSETHIARYRFVIHDGQLSPADAEVLWQQYAAPLQASPL